MSIVRIGFVAAAALLLVACAGTDDDQQPPGEESVASTEQAARACNVIALCVVGYHWDDRTCRCVKDRGTKCGSSTCAAGDVCCNESCGICTPPGGVCTQQICSPQ